MRTTQMHGTGPLLPSTYVRLHFLTQFTLLIIAHLALGRDHLPRDCVHEAAAGHVRHNTYGVGIVEEASGWSKTDKSSIDDITPSEIASSDSATETNSSRSGDLSALFRFAQDDLILIVDDSGWRRHVSDLMAYACSQIMISGSSSGLCKWPRRM